MNRKLTILAIVFIVLIAGAAFWYLLPAKIDIKPITFVLSKSQQNGVVYKGKIFRVILENPKSEKASFFINTRSDTTGEKLHMMDDSLNHAEEGACLVLKIKPVATGKVSLDVDREIGNKFEEFTLSLEVR